VTRSLYEISGDLQMVEAALVDAQDAEATALIEQFLSDLATERDHKIDNYCGLIRELQSRSETRAAEADRIRQLAIVDRNAVERLKERLLDNFVANGVKKVETEHFRVTRAKTGGKASLELDPIEPAEMPERFLVLRLDPNKDAIRAALEAGEEIPFARLRERGEHLRIS
jgi:hypothetical protein